MENKQQLINELNKIKAQRKALEADFAWGENDSDVCDADDALWEKQLNLEKKLKEMENNNEK